MKKQVKIAVTHVDHLDIKDLHHFQGNLKSLSTEDYNRLKKEILELGFSEPITAWKNGEVNEILNGHQRVRALGRMREEGIDVPKVPVAFVQADSIDEAKRKVLALTSQYGKMVKEGLYEFLSDTDIMPEELNISFRFPEIDLPKFTEEFYIDTELDTKDMDFVQQNDTMQSGDVEPSYEPIKDVEAERQSQAPDTKIMHLYLDEVRAEYIQSQYEAKKAEFGVDNLSDFIYEVVSSI